MHNMNVINEFMGIQTSCKMHYAYMIFFVCFCGALSIAEECIAQECGAFAGNSLLNTRIMHRLVLSCPRTCHNILLQQCCFINTSYKVSFYKNNLSQIKNIFVVKIYFQVFNLVFMHTFSQTVPLVVQYGS